jgi:hypothetical protein
MQNNQDKARFYPRGWSYYCDLLNAGRDLKELGFPCDKARMNRFSSRYRLARAFKSVELDFYAKKTSEGYSALFRLFLTWSAFEQFLLVIETKQEMLEDLIKRYNPIDLLDAVRNADTNGSFCDFLYTNVNNSHKKRIDEYREGKLRNPTYLASAVRHIFAHGHLGAYADAAKPTQIKRVSSLLSDFHLSVMDQEFFARLPKVKAS